MSFQVDPMVFWLTGLPSSGKTTTAYLLSDKFKDLGMECVVLDGDNIRDGLCRDLTFSKISPSECIDKIRGEVQVNGC